MQEKYNLLQEKFEREKKIAENGMLSLKLEDLKAKLEEKTKKQALLEEKLRNITDETPVQDRIKKKAYFESSLNYLDEKYGTTKNEVDSEAKKLEENETEYNTLMKLVNEKRKEVDLLKKQFATTGEYFHFYLLVRVFVQNF